MHYVFYKNDRLNRAYDVIVIGSGIGGLAAAAILSKAGKKVLVLERHYTAGGFTHTFQRKGYEWDVGVHYIGEVHRKNSVLRRAFDFLSDGQLDWAPMPEVYDKIFFNGDAYEYAAGAENFKQHLAAAFPGERKALDRYVDLLFQASRSAKGFFMEKALPPFFGKIARPFLTSKFRRFSERTTHEVLSSLTSDEKLIGVLSAQYGDYGLPPRQSSFAAHAMVAKHYLDGGNYPVGGSGRIAETIGAVIESSGGSLFAKAEVESILLRGSAAVGVRMKNGDEILAPLVISDVGVFNTFRLLEEKFADRFGILKKLTQIKASLSHLCLYLGFKESAESLKLPKNNLWIYPGYDHDRNIEAFVRDPSSPLPVVYISFPSAKDPSWNARFPGRSTIEIISFAPFEWFHRWEGSAWNKRDTDYKTFKEAFADRMLETLNHHLPQLKGKIDHREISTPLTTRHFCNYQNGEIYGLEHTPNRFRQNWLRPRTPIKNLFLTGQDIVTDGVGGALMAGVLSASVILKKNVMKEILSSPAVAG